MTREEAIQKLSETRILSTGMLDPLRIPFEVFLRYAQCKKETQDKVVDEILASNWKRVK